MLIIILLIIFLLLILQPKHEKFTPKNDHKKETKKYKLAIMAIFKNEEDYMEEWLEHHINQGVNHFYLYCNDHDIDKYPCLVNHKYNEYTTLIPWIYKANNGRNTIQRQAYTDCVQKYNHECQFLMMLDIDEFIMHTNKNRKVIDFINSIENEWKKTKAIKVQRYDFGSDGHMRKPSGKVIDNYKTHEKVCSCYKTIANSDFINIKKNFYGVHDFNYLNKPGKIYNSYFSYIFTGYPNGCKKESINEVPLVINHYYTKSYEEYLKRCRLWVDGGVNNINYRKNCKDTFLEKEKKIFGK
jgi:Glycosyltransferase family 92